MIYYFVVAGAVAAVVEAVGVVVVWLVVDVELEVHPFYM
jgi:hypothetical protein